MDKKRVSLTLPKTLVDKVDELSENRSNFFGKAALELIDDADLVQRQIDNAKSERDQLLEEKQRIERELEAKRDRIRSLEDLKTEVETLSRVKSKIPDQEIHDIRRRVREAKYDQDARSPAPEQVLRHSKKKLVKEHDGLKEEEVEEVLRITTEV